jgi:hypothetical protein
VADDGAHVKEQVICSRLLPLLGVHFRRHVKSRRIWDDLFRNNRRAYGGELIERLGISVLHASKFLVQYQPVDEGADGIEDRIPMAQRHVVVLHAEWSYRRWYAGRDPDTPSSRWGGARYRGPPGPPSAWTPHAASSHAA